VHEHVRVRLLVVAERVDVVRAALLAAPRIVILNDNVKLKIDGEWLREPRQLSELEAQAEMEAGREVQLKADGTQWTL
jgi:hypothetical protein